MKFGYTILYVDNVPATLATWQAAFGLALAFAHEDAIYGELATGETTLSFAETEFGRGHFDDEDTRAMFDRLPSRFEIGLVTDDVQSAYAKATAAGMTAVNPPQNKPWGQTVAWVRDPNGILVELASPMASG
jgi:catechol 2,3-dioxygenase-like lactoylglutathione lyase family enzyme